MFYNFTTQSPTQPRYYTTYILNITISHILAQSYINYMADVSHQIAAQIRELDELSNKPTKFIIRFTTEDELTFDDADQFYICSIQALLGELTTATPIDEKRLSVKNDNINLNYLALKNYVNHQRKIDVLSVEFHANEYIINMIDFNN